MSTERPEDGTVSSAVGTAVEELRLALRLVNCELEMFWIDPLRSPRTAWNFFFDMRARQRRINELFAICMEEALQTIKSEQAKSFTQYKDHTPSE